MPRVFGVNLAGVGLAGLAMFICGFLVYAVLFTGYHSFAYGYELEDFGPNQGYWLPGGLFLELVIALGIGKMLKVGNVTGLQESVKFALVLGLLIAVPMASYNFIYGPFHSVHGFMISTGHALVNFAIAGAILSWLE